MSTLTLKCFLPDCIIPTVTLRDAAVLCYSNSTKYKRYFASTTCGLNTTNMYLSFYNLKGKPFQISTDPRFLWLGEKHKEALATLRYGILDNKGFLLLTGDVGTGKTTLINALLNLIGDETVVATVPDPNLEKLDFFNYIAHAFNLDREFTSKGSFLVHFSQFLHDTYHQGKKTLLIIDEAQRIPQELLEEIRLLSNFERHDTKLLNIFFVGQNEFNTILLMEENRAVRQRITVNYNIEPLTKAETKEYIRHRLKTAGSTKQLFDDKALQEIYVFSQGYPRLINIICDRALLTGYVEEAKTISAKIVKECASELQIQHHLPHTTPQQALLGRHDKTIAHRPLASDAEGSFAGSEHAPHKSVGGQQATSKNTTANSIIFFLVCIILAGSSWYFYDIRQRPTFSPAATVDRAPVSPIPGGSKQQKIGQAPAVNAPEQKPAKTEQQPETHQVVVAEPIVVLPVVSQPPPQTLKQEEEIQTPVAEVSGEAEPEDVSLLEEGKKDIKEIVLPTVAFSDQKLIINFGNDSILPSDESLLELSQFADYIQEEVSDAKIIIKGYTDSAGSEQYNKKLSEFRANIIKGFLVGRGIENSRITTKGLGSNNPIASNKSLKGRMANRRVEIELSP